MFNNFVNFPIFSSNRKLRFHDKNYKNKLILAIITNRKFTIHYDWLNYFIYLSIHLKNLQKYELLTICLGLWTANLYSKIGKKCLTIISINLNIAHFLLENLTRKCCHLQIKAPTFWSSYQQSKNNFASVSLIFQFYFLKILLNISNKIKSQIKKHFIYKDGFLHY